jgi:lysophospholipase
VATPRAIVLIAPDLGEHSGRYEDLAHDLARAGLSTYALDHRGHGRSDGRRGHVRRFTRYIHDFERFRRRVVGSTGRPVPLILLGHSLGALILVRYLQEYPAVPARGLVLSAPAFGLVRNVPPWRAKLTHLLNLVVPALSMGAGIDPEDLSHDEEAVQAYRRDPLVHNRVTPRLYIELTRQFEIAFEKIDRLRSAVLVLIPTDDRLVRPDRMQRFAAALPRQERVQVMTLVGLYHDLLHESNRSSVVADLLGWIERRIALHAGASGSVEGT